MIDIATVLGLLGVSGVSAYKGVVAWRRKAVERLAASESLRARASRADALTRGVHTDALRALYAADLLARGGVRHYTAFLGDTAIPTSIVGAAESLRLARRFPSSLQHVISHGASSLRSRALPPLDPSAEAHQQRLAAAGVTLTNRPLYRLQAVDIGGENWDWQFTLDHYVHWHHDMAALADELFRALGTVGNDVAHLVSRRRELLPQRCAQLDTVAQICDPAARFAAGGPTITCAFRRRDRGDFAIPVRLRNSSLASGAGMLGIVAQGMHQHAIDAGQEASIILTAWRELYEELFGGHEVEDGDRHLRPDWFLQRSQALGWFAEHDGWRLYATGFGTDLLSGTYDLSLLLVVDDPEFYEVHHAAFRTNWEFAVDHARSPFVSSQDAEELTDLLRSKNWASSALFSFVRGLITLEREYPGSVAPIPLRD